MILDTAERANLNDNIANAAKLISKSKDRRAVFQAIYFGRKTWKSASELARATGLKRKRVVEEAKRIVDHKFARPKREHRDMWYSRDPILYQNKARILAAAADKRKLEAIPTRVRPHVSGGRKISISLGKEGRLPSRITVDDLASFDRVRKISGVDKSLRLNRFSEARVKKGFKSIIGESHNFTDWGGEKNDLFTTKLRVTPSTRKAAAFAFKGKGTTGTLTPKKLGKNGDQIDRLFSSDAEVFFVVYHGKVDESVDHSMHVHAIAKSMGGRAVKFGVIDGDDLNRLYQAYPKEFSR